MIPHRDWNADEHERYIPLLPSMRASASLDAAFTGTIEFRDALRELERTGRDSAVAILEVGGSVDDALGAWQHNRDAVIKARIAKGDDSDRAAKWADANLGSTKQVRQAVEAVAAAIARE